ncbi:RHOMBOID-like protein 1, partial [Mucuna pruriens]
MHIAPHSSMTMEGEPPQSEVSLREYSRQWWKVVHPMEIDPSFPSKVEQRKMKHLKEWFPWLIPLFVIVNVIVFIITMYVNDCPKSPVPCIAPFLGRFSFQPFNENPLLGPSLWTLRNMGALDVQKVVHRHQGWRLIACMWLHGGVFHLLANMFGLLVVGIRLEKEFGFVLIGLLFVISGFGGSLLSALFIEGRVSVGASGALFGLLGGMLSELLTNWSLYEKKLGALFTLLFVVVINLAVGILPHVDNFAHIGGFLSGFLLGFVFLIRPQFGWIKQRNAPQPYSPTLIKPKFNKYQCISWVLALLLLIFGLLDRFTTGLIALLRGVDANEYCSWCHYLSCVPTSRWTCNQKVSSCVIEQIGNQLNMTCLSNGKSSTFFMQNPTDSQIHELCNQICT